MKSKTINILEENIEKLCHLELAKDFLDMTLKAQSIKEKRDFVKIMNYCFSTLRE